MPISPKDVPTSAEFRLPALDAFRGFAALTIMLHHLVACIASPMPGSLLAYTSKILGVGWIAVDAFFVLSGYLIGSILLRERGQPSYYVRFYVRRCGRILPLYFLLIALFLTLRNFAPAWVGASHSWADPIPVWSHWIFVQNQFMAVQSSLGYTPLGVTWSLAVEEHFYLLVPWIIAILPLRILPWALLGGMIAAVLLRWATGGLTAYVLLPTRMDALLAGVFLAVLMATPRVRAYLDRHRKTLGFGGAISVLAGTAWLLLSKRDYGITGALSVWIMAWAWASSAMILAAAVTHSSVKNSQGWLGDLLAPLRWMGLRAYGIYLLHPWSQIFSFKLAGYDHPRLSETEGLLPVLLSIGLTLLLADISLRLLEVPAMRLGRQLFPPPRLSAA